MARITRSVSMRVPEEVYVLLSRAADEQCRNRTQQLLHYLKEGLQEDGYLPTEPTQEVDDE